MITKEYRKLLGQLKKRPSANLSIMELRAGFEKFLADFPPEPDIEFESFSIASIPACWAVAPGADRKRVILFFHGGGFNASSIKSHRDLIGRISRSTGWTVLAIDYRLAPEHPFPAALEDALESYRWLLNHHCTPYDLIVAGASAGGGLALSLCLRLKEENLLQPAAAVCICPMVDLSLHSDSMKRNKEKDWIRVDRLALSMKDYCKEQGPINPLISPLNGELHELPPLFIQVGSSEVLRDEIVAFAEKAKESDVAVIIEEWPEMVHCWQLFASRVPEGQKAIDHIGEFVRKIP